MELRDEEIQAIIKYVADEAWAIASSGGAAAEICLKIEALSDDPKRNAALLVDIKRNLSE